jgi:hypothetical protein
MNVNVMIAKMLTAIDIYFSRGCRWSMLVIFALLVLAWIGVFILGLAGYSGSKLLYIVFSLAATILLISGFFQRTSYSYLFLSVFLWLGFWFKLTIHSVLNYPFVEPVGSFLGMNGAWDDVLIIATVAFCGVFIGYIALVRFRLWLGLTRSAAVDSVVPIWYPKVRKWLWLILVVLIFILMILNIQLGIQQIGLAPRTVLFWPMNAVVSWLLNIGFATAVAVLLWWDIALRSSVSISVYVVIVEAFCSSVSVMSRAVYVFHSIPQLFAIGRFRERLLGWSYVRSALLGIVFVIMLIVSISAVSSFRNYLYQSDVYSSTAYQEIYTPWEVTMGEIGVVEGLLRNASPEERKLLLVRLEKLHLKRLSYEQAMGVEKARIRDAMSSNYAQTLVLLNEFGYQVTDGFTKRILQLVADRWIGLEGVMAVQAYQDKSVGLLWRALSGTQIVEGGGDIYQEISKSIYLKTVDPKFKFRTLPGAVAFLYYSGSLLIVFIGMAMFACAVVCIEEAVWLLTKNPIICSLYGAEVANNVAQFGGVPRNNLNYYAILMFGVLLVWLFNSNIFLNVLIKLKIYNDSV